MINFRNITLPQALVLIACMALPVAAYKFLGPEAAGVSAMAGMVLNFLVGRGAPETSPDA